MAAQVKVRERGLLQLGLNAGSVCDEIAAAGGVSANRVKLHLRHKWTKRQMDSRTKGQTPGIEFGAF